MIYNVSMYIKHSSSPDFQLVTWAANNLVGDQQRAIREGSPSHMAMPEALVHRGELAGRR